MGQDEICGLEQWPDTLACITGGIGSGKSVISQVLRLRGFDVYDCDSRAKQLMETDEKLRHELEKLAGSEIYFPDGTLDRKRLASLIFSSNTLRIQVNRLVHKTVREDIVCWRGGDHADRRLFVETAIPATSGLMAMVDRIWEVVAPESLRLARACRRDSVSEEAVLSRMQAQRSEFSSLPPDITDRIINDGKTPVLTQIDNLLKIL